MASQSTFLAEKIGLSLLAAERLPQGKSPDRGPLLDWCSPAEQEQAKQFKDHRRLLVWLMGRVVAKKLLLRGLKNLCLTPQEVTIVSRNARQQGDRPSVWHEGRRLPVSLSITHSDRRVLVALSGEASYCIGIDLVDPASVTPNVQQFWFTPRERSVAGCDLDIAAKIWAAKEATYKAIQQGESFFPLRFEVRNLSNSTCQCRYTHQGLTQELPVSLWRTIETEVAAYVETESVETKSPDPQI